MLSTLNVQHLESLNDQVAELSGIRVRETIPDALLGRADDIVVVDLTPEELLERLRAGKVYPVERIDAALNNFFKIENLSALREVALRQVAEEVGQRRFAATSNVGSREESIASEAPRAVAERLLALVEPYPAAHRLVRRAWRSAQRLGADLDLLWVRPPGTLSAEQENSLTALRQLASLLGARLIVEESDERARTIAAVAKRQRTTYILMGRARPATRAGATANAAATTADGAVTGCRRANRCRPGPAPHGGTGMNTQSAPEQSAPERSAAKPNRILLPFTNQAISRRAFEAAIRLAHAEGSTIVPAFLARVPRNLPIESPLPAACAIGMPLLEAIEQRATAEGIPVDSRVSRGRTYRDALERLLGQEHYDRVIVSATDSPRQGLSQDDLAWLLDHVAAEVLILRPAPDDTRRITATGVHGHF